MAKLELVVSAGRTSQLESLGELLPALEALRLDGSSLPSIRELGTGLRRLRSLSLARVGLAELDGIAALPALRELAAPGNALDDLTPLFAHDSLQVRARARRRASY